MPPLGTMLAIGGSVAILVAIVGGGVETRWFTVPKLASARIRWTLGVTGVALLLLGLYVHFSEDGDENGCPGRLDIVAPAGETEVRRQGVSASVVVSGTSQDVVRCGDESVVVAVHPVDPYAEGHWLSKSVAVAPDGLWQTTVFLGSEATPIADGQRFELIAVATDVDPSSLSEPVLDLAKELSFVADSPTVEVDVRLAAEVSIGSPVTDDVVAAEMTDEAGEARVVIAGAASGLASGDRVVVSVRAVEPSAEGWWPATPVDPDGRGAWTVDVFIGSATTPVASGQRFAVQAVVSDQDPATFVPPLANLDPMEPKARSEEVTFQISVLDDEPCAPGDLAIRPIREIALVGAVARVEVGGMSRGLEVAACAAYQVVVGVHPVEPPADGYWLSEAVPVSRDGGWQVTLWLGSEAAPVADGQRFELVAVVTDVELDSVASPVMDLEELAPVAWSAPVELPISDSRPDAEASIEFPAARSVVAAEPAGQAGVVDVRGEASGLSDGERVVVLVRGVEPAAEGWWPASPVEPEPGGSWHVAVFLGGASAPIADGQRFAVMAVVTERDPASISGPLDDPARLTPRASTSEVVFTVDLPPDTATLTVATSGAGSGRVTDATGALDCGETCAHDFEVGTTVRLVAAANAGSRFAGWDAPSCGAPAGCAVTLTAPTTVLATFDLIERVDLTVATSGTGSGRVTDATGALDCGETCVHYFEVGTTVRLEAEASADSWFAGWDAPGCGDAAVCNVTLTARTTVTATFELADDPNWTAVPVPEDISQLVESDGMLYARTPTQVLRLADGWEAVLTDERGVFDLDDDGGVLRVAADARVLRLVEGTFVEEFSVRWDYIDEIDVEDGNGYLTVGSWGTYSGPWSLRTSGWWYAGFSPGWDGSYDGAIARVVASACETDSDSGFVYGSRGDRGPSYFRTKDRGQTWESIDYPVLHSSPSCHVYSRDHLSTDGGDSWTPLPRRFSHYASGFGPYDVLAASAGSEGLYAGTATSFDPLGLVNKRIVSVAAIGNSVYALDDDGSVYMRTFG